ncbi:unnamed protein product [Meloidogyne enterolobii]|uniref:Uncharacterized protein n=1 Tax=Meloidogyne enterolobii TaxID=390850 RepID=A0ACB0Y517_MELEN
MDTEKSNQQNQLLTEVPPTLQQLLLTLVKIFYGIECYVIFCYIQKKIILKEEELRQVCKIDQRQLRKFLVTLKVEKFIKERLVPQEVDGKVRKFTYYFVNYKGALNVAKYKIDHIRQKLEVREKDDIHRAFYRCSNEGCKRQYDVMDMGKIFDPFTQEMRCWQCHSLVEQDELASGPSSTTRSSMAKFNEQMTGIFSLIKQMDGIRFGREITEPTIQAPIFKSEGETIELETRKVASLGQRAFFGAGKTRSDLYGGDITVSIGDDNIEKTLEAKAEIPWLLSAKQVDVDTTQLDGYKQTENINNASTSSQQIIKITNQQNDHLEGNKDEEEEEVKIKRPRRDEIALLLADEEQEESKQKEETQIGGSGKDDDSALRSSLKNQQQLEEDVEEEEEVFVFVQGERYRVDDINEALLAKMSEQEKSDYCERMQNAYADFY